MQEDDRIKVCKEDMSCLNCKTHLHGITLSEYLKRKMIPRGLYVSKSRLFLGQMTLNSKRPGLTFWTDVWQITKFTMSFSEETLDFLDVCVIKSGQSLSTDLFRRKMDRNNFLHAHSCHPPLLKKGLPVSQLHRIKRICSTDHLFETRKSEIWEKFKEKGYRDSWLD